MEEQLDKRRKGKRKSPKLTSDGFQCHVTHPQVQLRQREGSWLREAFLCESCACVIVVLREVSIAD
jgi:hypothetical protein